VVLEGIDGSGKGTQTRLLQERATQSGIAAAHISFPQYGKNPFAQVVSEYLNGKFGEVDQVHPKLAALLFAGDRYASKPILAEALSNNQLVILDRYVASNLAHQAAKLKKEERKEFIEWLHNVEFETYGMPKPDLTLYLDVPVEVATKLVTEKKEREYTKLEKDIHEKNAGYLADCKEVYESLVAQNIAGPWKCIECTKNNKIRPPEQILEELWHVISNAMLQTR